MQIKVSPPLKWPTLRFCFFFDIHDAKLHRAVNLCKDWKKVTRVLESPEIFVTALKLLTYGFSWMSVHNMPEMEWYTVGASVIWQQPLWELLSVDWNAFFLLLLTFLCFNVFRFCGVFYILFTIESFALFNTVTAVVHVYLALSCARYCTISGFHFTSLLIITFCHSANCIYCITKCHFIPLYYYYWHNAVLKECRVPFLY